MRVSTCLMVLAAPLALAACGSEEEGDVAEMPMAAEDMPMAGNTDGMPMATTGQVATAEGIVTAIDEEAGTITVDHGPVEAVGWPAMTMPFEADAGLREQVAVGDDVTFSFRTSDESNVITSISQK